MRTLPAAGSRGWWTNCSPRKAKNAAIFEVLGSAQSVVSRSPASRTLVWSFLWLLNTKACRTLGKMLESSWCHCWLSWCRTSARPVVAWEFRLELELIPGMGNPKGFGSQCNDTPPPSMGLPPQWNWLRHSGRHPLQAWWSWLLWQ